MYKELNIKAQYKIYELHLDMFLFLVVVNHSK